MVQTNSQEFLMRPVVVEAWQLHPDNLDLVAQWCRGRRRGMSIEFPKIRDRAKLLENQNTKHHAIVGDWIIRTSKGYVKMSAEEFDMKFAPTRNHSH